MSKNDPKMVVIGFGYLAEYIYPCYLEYLGKDKIATNVIAITADEKAIPSKRERFPFRVILNDNMGALNEMKPDIIHFAPPPSVAPMLAETVLKPYYDSVRAKGERLPDLYTYPPAPKGKYYLDLLGNDINVCNIIPNMVSELNGKKLKGEGTTLITIPPEKPWSEEEYNILLNFFNPLGNSIILTPHLSNKVLGSFIAQHIFSYSLFILADFFKQERGLDITHNQMASAMRAWMQEKYGFIPEGSNPCDKNAVPGWMYHDLGMFADALYKGSMQYCVDEGMDEEIAKDCFVREFDLYSQRYTYETREEIEVGMNNHATKGGVLEKGIHCQHVFLDPVLQRMLMGMRGHKMPAWFFDFLEKFTYQVSKIVAEHGDRLAESGRGEVGFGQSHHAILFGLMTRAALELGGVDGERAVIDGVKLYGLQRGQRMAMRAKKHGCELDCPSYQAFVEWETGPNKLDAMRSCVVSQSPVEIRWNLLCGWNEAWKAFGFCEEGDYYCSFVDEYLVRGFNDKLDMQITCRKSDLINAYDDVCEFVWYGSELTTEKMNWIEETRKKYRDENIKPWEYHIAHLFSAMSDRFRLLLPNAEEVIQKAYDEFVTIYGPSAKTVLDSAAEIDFNVI